MCRGVHYHVTAKDILAGKFERECKRARTEYVTLKELYKDVCWYDFETKCREWHEPWPESMPDSSLTLHGCDRYTLLNGREHQTFPVYYSGSVAHAPPLPVSIVLKEVHHAFEYWKECKAHETAPYDWAPGGILYLELVQNTLVGRTYSSDSWDDGAYSTLQTECDEDGREIFDTGQFESD